MAKQVKDIEWIPVNGVQPKVVAPVSNNNTEWIKLDKPTTINQVGGEFGRPAPTAQEEKATYIDNFLKDYSFADGVNEDEKEYLKDLARKPEVSSQQWRDALATVSGEHPKQQGYQTWYKDPQTGMPIPLAPGQKAPHGSRIESIWGSQEAADDDNPFTTVGKNLANTVNEFIETIGGAGASIQTMITGEEPKWFDELQQRTEMRAPRISSKAQEEILNTKNIKSFSDILNGDNWNFTADNVANGISQAASSILQFVGANLLTGGLASEVKVGTEMVAKSTALLRAQQFGASMMVNQMEAIDAAEEAGLEGREKFGMAMLYAAPASAIELMFGINAKILGNTEAQLEKKALAKLTANQLEKDAAGKFTAESIDRAYKETLKNSIQFGEKWAAKVAAEGGKEAAEEMAQGFTLDASQQIYDKLFAEGKETGQGKYGTDAFSPESFANRINEGIIGFLTGGAGAGIKTEKQSLSAFDAIKKGEQKAFKAEISRALDDGKITPEDAGLALQKLNAFDKYYEQTKNVVLDNVSKRRVFDLAFANENLNTQIEEISKDPESKIEGTIPAKELAATKKLLKKNGDEIEAILNKPIVQGQSIVAEEVKQEIQEEQKPKTTTTFKATSKETKEEKPADKAESIIANIGKRNVTTESLIDQIATAVNEKDVDAYIKEADEKGLTTPDLIDAAAVRRKDIKIDEIEAKRKQYYQELENIGIKGSGFKTNEEARASIDKMIDAEIKALNKVKKEELPINVKEKEIDELPANVKEKEAAMGDIALTDEVKDEPVLPTEKDAVIEKLKKTKSKQTTAKVIDRGKLFNNALGVELKIKGQKVIANLASSSSFGKHGIKAKEFIGKTVKLRYVPKEEWNADDKVINPLTNKPYGDKVEVLDNKGNVIANLEDVNYKKELERQAKEKETKKEKTPDQVIAEEEKRQTEITKKLSELKAPVREKGESIQSFAKRNKEYYRAKDEIKKQRGETKQGLGISDDVFMEKLWALIEAVAAGVTTVKKGLANLRKGMKEQGLSTEKMMEVEDFFDSQITELKSKAEEIEAAKELTDNEKQEAISKLTERFKEDYAKMQIGDGEAKLNELKSKVREFYTGIPEFKNDNEIEEMLIEVGTDEKIGIEKDFKEGIKKIYEQGIEENNEKKIQLAHRLNKLEQKDLIKIFNIFNSTTLQPYMEWRVFEKDNKLIDELFISNDKLEEKLAERVTNHLSKMTDSEYRSLYNVYLNKKPISFNSSVEYLEKVTGLTKEYWEFYKNTFNPTYVDKRTGKTEKTNFEKILYDFVAAGYNGKLGLDTKAKFLSHMTETKGKGKGSVVNVISRGATFEAKTSAIKAKFNNVEWNLKSSMEAASHLTNKMKEVVTPVYGPSNKVYGSNEWVQDQQGKKAPKIMMINGAQNLPNGKSSSAGNMSADDLRTVLLKMYLTKEAGEGYYLQNIGQFGDKDRIASVKAKKYTLTEAKKKYEQILKDEGRSPEDIAKFVKAIEKDAQSYKHPLLGYNEELAKEFVWNYNLNYHWISDFINGKQEQYTKKGTKPAYIDIVKRGGSTASPGIMLNKYVEGGVGESHKLAVINIPVYTNEKGNTKASLIDGQEFHLRSFSDKVKISSGEMFHTHLKAITSTTTPNAERLLIKTGSIAIDELAEQYPNSVYAKLHEFMVENGIDRLVTKDGAKYLGGFEAYELFDEKGNVIEKSKRKPFNATKHLNTISTDNYLLQQDLTNDGKPYEATVPVQRRKNMMHSKEASTISALYNEIAKQEIELITKELESQDTGNWRAYLMKQLNISKDVIDDTINNAITDMADDEVIELQDADNIKELLANNVSFQHPHLSKWLGSFVANIISNKALGRKTNKSLLVEVGYVESPDFKLNKYRVENGKVFLPEVAISEATGLRGPKKFKNNTEAISHIVKNKTQYQDMFDLKGNIRTHEIIDGVIPGEYHLITRIPADAMHSHTLARVKYLLPKEMGNVIITPNQSQEIAGSDFDGDMRTVEMFFKRKNKTTENEEVIIGDKTLKNLANKAFQLDVEDFYRTENVESFTEAIDGDMANDALEKLPKEKVLPTDSPDTYIDSRIKNSTGLAVVGIMANLQAAYDYLRVHKSGLKNKLAWPKITLAKDLQDRKIDKSLELSDFKDDNSIKTLIGNLLNFALDNVKDPKIERLGLNEVTVKAYNTALMLGMDFESVVAFFTHPTIKEYVNEMRKTRSVSSKELSKDVIGKLAARYMGIPFEGKTVFGRLNNSSNNTADFNNEKSLYVLQKLREINKVTKDIDSIITVIKATEDAPKTWADWMNASKLLVNVQINVLENINTSGFETSTYLVAVQQSLNLSRDVIFKTAPEMTETGALLYDKFFEGMPFIPKKDLVTFSQAIHNTVLSNSRKRNEPFADWSSVFLNRFKALKEANKYPEITKMLETTVEKVKDLEYNPVTGKFDERRTDGLVLQLNEGFKRNEIPEKDIKAFQKALTDLTKSEDAAEQQLAKDIIDYNIFKYNLSASKSKGSYSVLFPIPIHKQIGTDVETEYKEWENGAYTELQIEKMMMSIAKNNPSINPTNSVEQKKQTVKNKLYEPFAKRENKINVPKLEAYQKMLTDKKMVLSMSAKGINANVAQRIDKGDTATLSSGNESVKIEVVKREVDTKENNAIISFNVIEGQQQKKTSLPKTDLAIVDTIVQRLKKAIPKAIVVYDHELKAAGELSADGKLIRINPFYAGTDTPIHEFAHILIDALGGVKNPLIAKGIQQLKGSKLWERKAKQYTELSDEMLAKEVLAEAIGIEGAKLFEDEQKQNKFMSWLSGLFYTIRAKLGLEKNIAKQLARELLSKKDLQLKVVGAGQVQRQEKDYNDMTPEEQAAFWKADAERQREEQKQQMLFNDLEKNKASDIDTYSLRFAPQSLNELKAKKEAHEIRARELEKTKNDSQSITEANKAKTIGEQIKALEQEFKNYLENYEEVIKFYKENTLSDKSLSQLHSTYVKFRMMNNNATAPLLKDIQIAIAKKMRDEQIQNLKEKFPNKDFENMSKEDLKGFDVYMKALSDFSEVHPEMQMLANKYFDAYKTMLDKREDYKIKILKAAQDVIKEYNKKHGIKSKAENYFNPFASNAKYWTFMEEMGRMIQKEDKNYAKLTDAQKALVDIINDAKYRYAKVANQGGKADFDWRGLIKTSENFSDVKARSNGLMDAYINYIQLDKSSLDGVYMKYRIDGKDELLTFSNIKHLLNDKAKNKEISKVKVIAETIKYKLKAKKLLQKRINEDNTPIDTTTNGEFTIDAAGRLVSKYSKPWAANKKFSKDYVRAVMEFIDEMTFVQNMQGVLPYVEAIETLSKATDANGQLINKNMAKYIQIWKDGNILRKDQELLGEDINAFIKFFRKLTHLRFMAFNVPAAGLNVFIGKYNQFRGDNFKFMKEGEKRYWSNPKKAQAILRRYRAVSIEVDTNPNNHIGKLFNGLMFGLTKLGENWIQGGAVLGQMTKEEWEAFDKEGNLITKDDDLKRQIVSNMEQYKKKVRDIQGKYADEDKRNFAHFELGRAIGQFKIWIPDMFRDRLAPRYIDMYGNERQGTLHYLVTAGISDLKNYMFNKEFWNGNDLENQLRRRNLRSAILFASFVLAYSALSDDDEEVKGIKQKLGRAIGDMAGIFNMSTAEFVVATPMASAATITDMLDAVQSLILLEQYNSDGKYGDEGDLKAPGKFGKLIPYQKIVTYPMELLEDEE